MSRRQDARADRIYRFWIDRFSSARGSDRLEVAASYLAARINDAPKKDRQRIFEAAADELIALADRVTEGQLRKPIFASPAKVPKPPRAQARGAGARGTA